MSGAGGSDYTDLYNYRYTIKDLYLISCKFLAEITHSVGNHKTNLLGHVDGGMLFLTEKIFSLRNIII